MMRTIWSRPLHHRLSAAYRSGPSWVLVCVVSLSLAPLSLADGRVHHRAGKFVRVYDVANIVVKRFNGAWMFRLLGVRPVIGLPSPDPIELESGTYLTELLRGQRIRLELDESVPADSDSRVIAGYAYLKDGTCLNEAILRLGYGVVDELAPAARLERFRTLESAAKLVGAGIWDFKYAPATRQEDVPCPDGTMFYDGGCGVIRPEVIPESKAAPEYPRKARRKGIQGLVVLDALVTRDGRVSACIPMRSRDVLLTAAAMDAVAQWRYRPAIRDGQPIDVRVTIFVDFVLLR